MKIRISYLVEIDDDFRAALACRHGREGLATREEIKAWYEQNGSTCNDDLMEEWYQALGNGKEVDPSDFT